MNQKMKTHKDLTVWNESISLVTKIYGITKTFPKDEQFGLTSQIRRASVSVASNIAEGAARASKKEFKHFLSIALGSSSELETQIIIAKNLNYINESVMSELLKCISVIQKMIYGLIKSLKIS